MKKLSIGLLTLLWLTACNGEKDLTQADIQERLANPTKNGELRTKNICIDKDEKALEQVQGIAGRFEQTTRTNIHLGDERISIYGIDPLTKERNQAGINSAESETDFLIASMEIDHEEKGCKFPKTIESLKSLWENIDYFEGLLTAFSAKLKLTNNSPWAEKIENIIRAFEKDTNGATFHLDDKKVILDHFDPSQDTKKKIVAIFRAQQSIRSFEDEIVEAGVDYNPTAGRLYHFLIATNKAIRAIKQHREDKRFIVPTLPPPPLSIKS